MVIISFLKLPRSQLVHSVYYNHIDMFMWTKLIKLVQAVFACDETENSHNYT